MSLDDNTGNIGQYGEDIGTKHIEQNHNSNRAATTEEKLFMGLSDGLAKAQRAYNKMQAAEHQIETDGDNIQAEMDLGYSARDLSNSLKDISDQAIAFRQRIEPEDLEKPEPDNWADRMANDSRNADLGR